MALSGAPNTVEKKEEELNDQITPTPPAPSPTPSATSEELSHNNPLTFMFDAGKKVVDITKSALDTNKDGKVSLDELLKPVEAGAGIIGKITGVDIPGVGNNSNDDPSGDKKQKKDKKHKNKEDDHEHKHKEEGKKKKNKPK